MSEKKTSDKEEGVLKLIWRFLYSKVFLINLAAAIIIVVLSYPLINWILSSYSDHGSSVTVPDLAEVNMEDLSHILEEKGLRYYIVDSIFNREGLRGVVLEQDPLPGDLVKTNRTIYVTVSRKAPEMIQMPDLIDKSSRHATSVLEIRGLKVKEMVPRATDICEGCVLEQLYEGEPVAHLQPVPYGAKITLVVGQKEGNARIGIPKLKGLTIEEATQRLNERSLNLGAEVYKDCLTKEDSAAAVVYKQSPGYSKYGMLSMGSAVDLWLSLEAATPDSITPSP